MQPETLPTPGPAPLLVDAEPLHRAATPVRAPPPLLPHGGRRGADPARFGLGVQVLRPILHRADAEGAATFLETQTEEHEAFYEKLGFKTVQFTPREDEPLDIPVWRMIRPAPSMS
jgi:hypothetical protein